MGIQLFHADTGTDRHDETISQFSQFCERAKKLGLKGTDGTQFSAIWPADVSWPDVTDTQVANTFHWVTTLCFLLEKWSHKKSFCFSLQHLLETALGQNISSRRNARTP